MILPSCQASLPRCCVRHSGNRSERGSVLIVALMLVAIIGISLVSYVKVSNNSLKLSQRTFFADSANNLAETGLEEAVWSFNQMGSGIPAATAWTDWTLDTTNNIATRTLPTFSLDQNASGTVKVYVNGYNGNNAAPVVVAKAAVAPFDGGAPVVKIIEVTLKFTGKWQNGVVAKNGITWNGHPTADSFISTSNIATGPYLSYTSATPRSNTTVASQGGSIDLAHGDVEGNVKYGAGVSVSGGNTITGTTTGGFTGDFTLPIYPTTVGLSQYYNLGSAVSGTLPAAIDLPASDGKYYYFVTNANIGALTITAGKSVVIVGSANTRLGAGLVVQSTGSVTFYIDGVVDLHGNGVINNVGNWAGACQIFTSTASGCTIGGNGNITCCLFCPNAALTCDGGGSSGSLTGSFVANTITSNGHMDFHYDEMLAKVGGSKPWAISLWREMQSASERSSVAGNFNF